MFLGSTSILGDVSIYLKDYSSNTQNLLFQTTSTSTSTTSMVTYCFSTTGTISKNCRRKKRAINDAPNDEGNYTKLLSFLNTYTGSLLKKRYLKRRLHH